MPEKLSGYLKKKLKGADLAEIADIFLFGSAAKGKEFPKDIDICVVFRKRVSEEAMRGIERKLQGFDAHMSSLVMDDFFRKPHSLIKTLLVEGISVLTGRKLSQNFGFASYVLYSYDLSKLDLSKKVKFVYLLKGRRGMAGIIEKMNGEWIADSCFIMPVQKDSELLIMLKKWQVPFKRKEALIH